MYILPQNEKSAEPGKVGKARSTPLGAQAAIYYDYGGNQR
jgi:hypothetical protein